MPLVIQKSKRSDSLLVSLGQYMVWYVDRCCRLSFLIVLCSSLPFVAVSLEPQKVFLAL